MTGRQSDEILAPRLRFVSGSREDYLFPLARLCVTHSIWQFLRSVPPPFDHAVTWSASISSRS